jgi:copper(I)-binding protein
MKHAWKLAVIGLSLFAAQVAVAEVTVKDAWVRATVAQQKATGAFMTLQSSVDARVVAASSPIAGIAEIHEMKLENNVMKMRAVDGLELPAGKAVELKPGSFHVMLQDLKSQVKEGDEVLLQLTVEGKDKKRETVEIKAKVRGLTQTGK